MKKSIGALFTVLLLSSGSAFAEADPVWIGNCVKDTDPEGNPANVVQSWCACMDSKMADGETKSILEWQNTDAGKKANTECDGVSGWK